MRRVAPRAIKETFVPPTDYKYPFVAKNWIDSERKPSAEGCQPTAVGRELEFLFGNNDCLQILHCRHLSCMTSSDIPGQKVKKVSAYPLIFTVPSHGARTVRVRVTPRVSSNSIVSVHRV